MAGKYCKKTKNHIALILVVLLLIAGTTGIVAAKYIANHQKEAEIHASSFHFSSDSLEYGAVPAYTVFDDGSHSVAFSLYNYQKENIAQISDMEIPYTVQVSEGWSVQIQGSAATQQELPGGIATEHKVILTRESAGSESVDVTVTSNAPYEMELKATFTLMPLGDATYTVTDAGDYAVMTIHTNSYAGDIEIDWNPENHSPDNTNPLMASWTDTFSADTFAAEAYSVYELIFVENQPVSTTNNDFAVTTGA